MSTESKSKPALRGGVVAAAVVAASVLAAVIVDGTQSSADASSVPIGSDPATADQPLPADHPPVSGVQAFAGADQQLPPGHPPIDGAGDGAMAGECGSAQDTAMPAGHPPVDGASDTACGAGQDSAMPAGHPPTQGGEAQAIEPGSIAAAQGEGAVTVSTLIREAKAYDGKKVRIAAKVMRSTPNVLGKNWLHVGDGSGSPDKGDHDLVVTTLAELEVGQVVMVEGVVARDKDLGSGYRYEVLVEDARVTPVPEG